MFHRDGIYLLLGIAFVLVGTISGLLATVRRQWRSLLSWLAAFSVLGGCRLCIRSDVSHLVLADALWLEKLRVAFDYALVFPALEFFKEAGNISRPLMKVAGGMRRARMPAGHHADLGIASGTERDPRVRSQRVFDGSAADRLWFRQSARGFTSYRAGLLIYTICSLIRFLSTLWDLL